MPIAKTKKRFELYKENTGSHKKSRKNIFSNIIVVITKIFIKMFILKEISFNVFDEINIFLKYQRFSAFHLRV